MWNLAPTGQPDPAVNPRAELLEPPPVEPDVPLAAGPLVVPKPITPISDLPGFPAADSGALPILPFQPDAPAPATADVEPAEPEPEAEPTRAELPPGTTAHEFDPFAPDLFPPTPAPTTPVPPVDEFTIPDEGGPAQASVPAAEAAEDQPTEPEVSSDWEDISDLLGAHPQTVDTGIVSPMPPINEILPSFDGVLSRPSAAPRAPEPAPATAAAAPVAAPAEPPARPADAPIEHSRGDGTATRWLLIVAAVLLAVLIGIALFALGRAVAAGRDTGQAGTAATASHTKAPKVTTSPTPSITPTPTNSPAVPPAGPLPAGQSYQWDLLRGGECINPFTTPWVEEFAVVDCNAQHAAQLVYTAPYSSDPGAAFPGEKQIASQINLLCTKPGIVDLGAAGAYSDVQLVASYPVDQQQWDAGQRNYYCFVTRASGQAFTSSIAGPGPTQ
jgi:hypothetical protein